MWTGVDLKAWKRYVHHMNKDKHSPDIDISSPEISEKETPINSDDIRSLKLLDEI